jgi:hypothetical protein
MADIVYAAIVARLQKMTLDQLQALVRKIPTRVLQAITVSIAAELSERERERAGETR